MKKIIIFFLLLSFNALSQPVQKPVVEQKKLKVVTTISVLAALAREIGGNRIDVASLTKASEDPHFVKPKPTFKRLVSEADLFMQVGRSLELWVPQVINSSQNKNLISGKNLITLSNGVSALEVPKNLTRNSGDIHPNGNPHIWLSPLAAKKMASNIKDALIAADSSSKAIYEKNYNSFNLKLAEHLFGQDLVKSAGSSFEFLYNQLESGQIREYLTKRKKALGGWLLAMSQVDYPIFTYHTVFSYFLAQDFSLKIVGQIEEKAGVLPSKKYQNLLVKNGRAALVKNIVAASYYKGIGHQAIETIAKELEAEVTYISVDCEDGETYFDYENRIIGTFVKLKNTAKPVAPVKKSVNKNAPANK